MTSLSLVFLKQFNTFFIVLLQQIKDCEELSSPRATHLQTQAPADSSQETTSDILEAIEGAARDVSVSFTALVQRVCDGKLSGGQPQRGHYSVLLQDSQHCVCELWLTWQLCDRLPQWRHLVECGDSRVFTFRKLRVSQRTNRARYDHEKC